MGCDRAALLTVAVLALAGSTSVAGILETEPVQLSADDEEQLRAAAAIALPAMRVRSTEARQAVGDAKVTADVDFEPFETGPDHMRYHTVYCVKYYAPWSCRSPEQEMEMQLASGRETVRVDPSVSSRTVVELARFIKSRPRVQEHGEDRQLTEAEVRHLRSIRKLGWWRYQVGTSDGFTRGARIVVERRLLSWPVGSLQVTGIEVSIA